MANRTKLGGLIQLQIIADYLKADPGDIKIALKVMRGSLNKVFFAPQNIFPKKHNFLNFQTTFEIKEKIEVMKIFVTFFKKR